MNKQKLGTCDKSSEPHWHAPLEHDPCINWKPIKKGWSGFLSGLGNAIGEALSAVIAEAARSRRKRETGQ